MVKKLAILTILVSAGCSSLNKLTESELESGRILRVEKDANGKTRRVPTYVKKLDDSVVVSPLTRRAMRWTHLSG